MYKPYNELRDLVSIDSPSGYTEKAADYIVNLLQGYGYSPTRTEKGSVCCALGENPTLCIAAHADTLGAMVAGINENGTLRFTPIGGPVLATFESAYVTIYKLDGSTVCGTVLLNNPSSHANKQAATSERNTETMHIRLDEEVRTAEDVRKLGINTGDIIAFDPRYTELENGFIKSHFMDNKAGCYVLFEIARRLSEEQKTVPVELYFSVYEEVGHGGSSGISRSAKELLVIDMGVVGNPCEGDEYSCSICAKDSSGPYDYNMRKELMRIAGAEDIPYKVDVYPFYSSDGSLALRAGYDVRVGLVGPGVAASHGMERTHKKGVEATIDLCMAYLKAHHNNA